MPSYKRSYVIALMHRAGHFDQIPTAQQLLPDIVDLDRDKALLESLGLTQGRLMEDLAASP